MPHHAASDRQDRPDGRRPLGMLIVATVVLIATIAGGNLFFLTNLRDSLLLATESSLSRHSLMLAEQTDRSFKSVDLVLSGIADHIGRQGVTDTASYQGLMSRHETFLLLQERIRGLPHVEAVTLIDAKGTLINFSRSWPIPDVNVTDRDYYMVLKDDPKLESYISAPVRNRATSTWNIYVARRLNAPDGTFLGLVLGAVSMEYFANFFGITVMGPGNTIWMVRDDGSLLARFPRSADRDAISTTAQRALNAGGIVRETSPSGHERRIVAARQLANYPVAVAVSQTEESALVEWRRMATLLGVTSAGCCLLIVIAALVIARWWRDRDRAVRTAQAASDAKSSFLAVMSHEIRTPMNAVLGLAAELLNTPLTEEQRRSVVAMHGAGDNLLELLNDILDFSKLEAGRLSFEALAFSPESLVDNAVSVVGPRAAAKGLAVKTVRETALPQALVGDAGRIRQVLLNLLSNAVKFTARGEVVVAIRCLARDGGHATIEWSITDTGIGIPPDRIKDLFQDFSQADTSISRRFGGSGLGLSICKRLIEQMGGEISVVSAPGQGSTFRFSLALPIAQDVALVGHNEPEPAFPELRAHIAALGRPLRVLVVDDNATNRLVAAKMLKEFDAQIATACDGAEAVAAATRFDYDVILMDMRMPEMDGLEATRTIRARGGKLAGVAIVAFTANAYLDDVNACREAGMNGFVAKPVRKKELVAAIVGALRAVSAEGATAEAPTSEPAADDGGLPVFDRARYDEMVEELGEDGVRTVVEMFLAETDRRIALLRGLAGLGDRIRIGREAHSLKGDAAALGLAQLAGLAEILERDARHMGKSEYRGLLDRIEPAYVASREKLPKQPASAA
jgi:signal transduction histidine kinase/DNA-binding response OmpR family regulator